MAPRGKRPLLRRALSVLLVCSAAAATQEGPQDWIKRILDPASIGVPPFPGSELSRKISADTIRFGDARKKVAVYMAPLEQMKAVVEHFRKTLKVEPQAENPDTPFARYTFILAGKGDYPKSAEGLIVTILRSPYVDNRTQIQMIYAPPP